jgi:two-component system phosphate regulon sensor histidine kinase PhoR
MSPVFILATVLGVALVILGLTLLRLRSHLLAVRQLRQAISRQQRYLREDHSGALGRAWEDLCDATGDLVEETARLRQLRASHLAQLEATLGSLREAVLIIDSGNRVVLANQALQEIFPHTARALGQRLESVLRGVAFLHYVEMVRQGAAQPQQEIEFVEGGHSTWVEATGAPIRSLDGAPDPWALFVLHDITRQKKLEAVRREFVANVSHELRTPLSVIKGYVETLVDGHREIPVDDRERFLRTIQRHTERLNSLLEDLLTLSRLESVNPGLKREPLNLARLLEEILDDYRARPAAAGHRLNANLDRNQGSVPADPLKFTQAVENLLDNALKYTPAGSTINVSLRLREGDAEVSVQDNGPGIPPMDLPHIFERFYRVEKGRSREKGGTGLGLSIVKHIVQLHGGRVRVESVPGQGTAFYFSLPLVEKRLKD